LVSALMGGASSLPGINFDAMADHVERSFVPGFLESLIDPVGQRRVVCRISQPIRQP
jgi:hypothetical protein